VKRSLSSVHLLNNINIFEFHGFFGILSKILKKICDIYIFTDFYFNFLTFPYKIDIGGIT